MCTTLRRLLTHNCGQCLRGYARHITVSLFSETPEASQTFNNLIKKQLQRLFEIVGDPLGLITPPPPQKQKVKGVVLPTTITIIKI